MDYGAKYKTYYYKTFRKKNKRKPSGPRVKQKL